MRLWILPEIKMPLSPELCVIKSTKSEFGELVVVEVEGDFEAEWVMNSYRRGALTVNGSPRPLVRDHRLRNAILPFVSRGARWSAPIRSRWKVGRAPTRGSEPPPPPVAIGGGREED